MVDHPGVLFRDGPSGRRAVLAYGPDVWEIIKFVREVDERGAAALEAAGEVFDLEVNRIVTALSYYADCREEIDAEVAIAEDASERAEHAWRLRQQVTA
jgi:DNA-binding PucR family transcriptional regulator